MSDGLGRVSPEPEVVEALDGMARRIPYLGRSTGVALVGASAGAGSAERRRLGRS